jgi:flagellar export protein FliJ
LKKAQLKYRLEPMLVLKTRAKKNAEIRLAQALARLEQEKKRLEKLKEEKEAIIKRRKECRRELQAKMLEGQAHARDGSMRVNYLRKLEEDEQKKEQEIENQKQVIENCELMVKRARRDYIDAVKELRVIEKHKELWRKKLQKELSRIEEREMDELGNVIHQLKNVA